jgi:uncharacterized protein YegL
MQSGQIRPLTRVEGDGIMNMLRAELSRVRPGSRDASPSPRRRAIALASLLAALAGLGLAGVKSEPPLRAQNSNCTVETRRTVSPVELRQGETLTVTLNFRADCANEGIARHFVFVLDASGSMAGLSAAQMQDALRRFVDRLDLPAHPEFRVGIVAYKDEVSLRCDLSNDGSALRACLARYSASGGGRQQVGILEGLDVLEKGRSLVADAGTAIETMVVLTDGAPSDGCSALTSAAQQVKNQGVLLTGVCLGPACDTACMRQVSSSPRYFYQLQSASGLLLVFERARTELVLVSNVLVFDHIPTSLRLIEGSVGPSNWNPLDSISQQISGPLPSDGMTYTFQAEALETGSFSSSREAEAHWRDYRGAEGISAFPIQVITVSLDSGAPTPAPLPQPLAALDLSTTELAIGETASLTYQLDFDLPEPPGETHLAIVADVSGSMAGENLAKLKEGAGLMLDRLESLASDRFAASIVSFNSAARTLCVLTPDFGRLRACVDELGPAAGGTSIDSGLSEGHVQLKDGRPWDFGEDLVLFSDGANNTGCAPVLQAADAIKVEDIVLHTVCFGAGCDAACLRQAASSPSHFFQIDQAGVLPDALGGIADDILSRRGVERVDLSLTLPAHLRLVPGSFTIAPDASAEQSATWSLRGMPADGLELDFDVEAIAPGDGEIRLDAQLTMLRAAPLEAEAKSAPIRVPGSPTAGSPSQTPGTVTATPSSLPPSLTPPPSAAPPAIYLPLLLHEACAGAGPTDLVLLLDSSLSMAEAARDGGSKLDAALEAARGLIEGLDLGEVRVAVIGFDAEAHLRQSLTADAGLLGAALSPPALASGTAIDRGIAAAHAELISPHSRGDVRRVMVLLTDGRAFPSSPAEAIASAVAARTAGIEIHAVGLGNEVDAATLRAVASSAAHYRAAAGRLELLRAFRMVAGDLACPGVFWNAGG